MEAVQVTAFTFPDELLSQHLAIVGKSGSGLPAYKRNPRLILCVRACSHCGAAFLVARKYPQQQYCSRKCVKHATLPADHNARVARLSREKRGDAQRGRGAGKTYRKLLGRHEHRVVAEQKLGRALAPGEVVHHADERIANNAPENLDVLPSQAEHARRHFTGKKQSAEHVRKRVESRRRTLQKSKQ